MGESKTHLRIQGREFFAVMMTPQLPEHTRWAPHRLLILTRSSLIRRFTGTQQGAQIALSALDMLEKNDYRPINGQGIYPYYRTLQNGGTMADIRDQNGGFREECRRVKMKLRTLMEMQRDLLDANMTAEKLLDLLGKFPDLS